MFEKFYKAFCHAVDQREILRESSKPKKKKDPYENLPHAIKTLLELQDEDGKWTISLRKLESSIVWIHQSRFFGTVVTYVVMEFDSLLLENYSHTHVFTYRYA